jgi:hypothetical protein
MVGAGAGFVLVLLADWSRVGGWVGLDRVEGVEGRELVKVLSVARWGGVFLALGG